MKNLPFRIQPRLAVFVLALLLALPAAPALSAAGRIRAENLFARYENAPGAESVRIGGVLLKFLRAAVALDEEPDESTDAALRLIRNLRRIEVVDLSECPEEIRERFRRDVRRTRFDGYETAARIQDEGETARILIRLQDESIREIVIIDESEPAYIRISGRISEEELKMFIENETR